MKKEQLETDLLQSYNFDNIPFDWEEHELIINQNKEDMKFFNSIAEEQQTDTDFEQEALDYYKYRAYSDISFYITGR